MLVIAGLICGLIFGWGLLISDMVQPAKVLAFLDIFGAWDPSLAVVMIAALVVSVPGFRLAKRRERPILATQSVWPTKMGIYRPLVMVSALFGIGWGLVGLCPGPALENLATLSPRVIVFVVAMTGGMALHDFWQKGWPTIGHEGTLVTAADGGRWSPTAPDAGSKRHVAADLGVRSWWNCTQRTCIISIVSGRKGRATMFRQLFDQTSGTYSYLLASRPGGEALIIDPVLEKVDRYLQLVKELDLKLVKAVDTHLHADHITGLGALRD